MWALGFWLDGFLPIWPESIGPDVIRFDLGVNVGPGWSFLKGTLVSYVRTISYWRYTTVKR
jgi:hypothetical protein